MDRCCEFCTEFRAVVICKADSAYLCLSCDTKVHSANALSSRHLRSLLCDSCILEPACAQCLHHRVYLCHDCDLSSHQVCSQHNKRVVRSYMGCPSAKDFAVLWGFRLDDELDNKRAAESQLCSTSSAGPVASTFGFSKNAARKTGGGSSTVSKKKSGSALKSGAGSYVISSSRQSKVSAKGEVKQETSFILQQIRALGDLELAEAANPSVVMNGQKNTSNNLQDSRDLGPELQSSNIPPPGLKIDPLVLPFSQSENSPLTSTSVNGLLGESFWQCKSPFDNSQLWSQTMQDLGVCEDFSYNDLNIPDVDISFRNFEELFRGDQDDPIREMLDDKDASFSMDKSNNFSAMETSFASAVCGSHPQKMDDKPKEPLNQVDNSVGNPHFNREPFRSTMSFSVSQHSTDSIATEDLDSAVSPSLRGLNISSQSLGTEGAHLDSVQKAMSRYMEKKTVQSTEKRIRYAPRKAKGDVRKRVKSRSTKAAAAAAEEEDESHSHAIAATRSY